MDSLPSAQGWTYAHDLGPDEDSVFSISDGTLFQDDTLVRVGDYRLSNVVDPSLTFDLSMTLLLGDPGGTGNADPGHPEG